MPERPQPIRVLLLDYGEVLCEAPDPDAFAEMARVAGVEPAGFDDAYWSLRPAYDRGELDGPAYWQLLGERTGARIDGERVADLVEHDVALWARVDERMLTWANDIAASGVPVGLLSNMVAEIGEHLRDSMQLFERFTSVTYSYEVGLAKPDPRIYHHALESLSALAHETLFVDDREVNVEAARSLGLHVHHFHGRNELLAEITERYTFA